MSHCKYAPLAIVLLLILHPLAGWAVPTAQLSDLRVQPVEGQQGWLQFDWNYDGPVGNDVRFQLFVYRTEDILSGIGDISSSERSHRAYVNLIQARMKFLLIAMQGNSSIAETGTILSTPLPGGFTSFTAQDVPFDAGGTVKIEWALPNGSTIRSVEIYQAESDKPTWDKIQTVPAVNGSATVSGLTDGTKYRFKLRGTDGDIMFESDAVTDIVTVASWFDMRKINLLIILIILTVLIGWFNIRKSSKPLFIRKIAGLQAVEEAVGRATEMGRSVLFVPGISDLDDVQTIAGLTILSSVAKTTAQYETRLDVPVCRSLVMSNGREVVKEAYLSVGRPDFYNDNIVHYITDEQFGYAAGVDGIMVREKPAACFYMGSFFAESLILAETGNSVGAIQIAGTAMPSQLPFFVAACDYTLIGEELFAASAYLSNDQKMIGTLCGQDMGKVFAGISIVAGVVLVSISTFTAGDSFIAKLTTAFARLFALNY